MGCACAHCGDFMNTSALTLKKEGQEGICMYDPGAAGPPSPSIAPPPQWLVFLV